ncbi:hypothetical protein AALA90_07955 [Lachnospiraceae bacterium 38-10]
MAQKINVKLLWQEYQDQCRAAGSIPMGYTKYCKGYPSSVSMSICI